MSKPSDSLFVPAATPKREHDDRRYDQLAKAKEWTRDQLRKCGDLPRKKLPPGIKVEKLPADVLEDPFKNVPNKDEDQVYNTLEKRFYDKLMNMEMTGKSHKDKSDHQPISTKSARPAQSMISQKMSKSIKSTKSVAPKKSQEEED